MDTKSRKFSHPWYLKAVALVLAAACFSRGACQIFDLAGKASAGSFMPTLAESYENDSAVFCDTLLLEDAALHVATKYEGEESIQAGKFLTQSDLRIAYYQLVSEAFYNYSYNYDTEGVETAYELTTPDGTYWQDALNELIDQSTFALSCSEDGKFIMRREGPEAPEPLARFESENQQQIQQIPQELIRIQLSDYRWQMRNLQTQPALRYYIRHGEKTFANASEEEAVQAQQAEIFLVMKKGEVQIQMGESRVEGDIYDEYFSYQSGGAFNTQNSYGWLSTQLRESLLSYDEEDTAYIWFTDDYPLQMQEQVTANREMTIQYLSQIGGAFLITLFLLGYLLRTCGRKRKGDEIRLYFIDRVFTEVLLALGGLAVTGYVFSILLSWQYQEPDLLALCSWAVFLVITAILLSFGRRFKARTFWKSCLLCHFFQLLAAPFRKAARAFRELSRQELTVKQAMLFTGLYGSFCLLLAIVFPLSIALIIAAVLFVGKMASAFQKVREGVSLVRQGDLTHQIDLGDEQFFAGLADDVNSIADGLHNAVESELKSERMKSELITNVSHDIRTPLTSIITYADLLQKEGLESPNASRYCQVIGQKAQRLKMLTDDLFEVSKAASGNIQVDLAPVELCSLIRQGMGELSDKMEQSGLDFRIHLPAQGVWVKADGKLLWRVVENLLSNVFKYAMPSSRVYLDVGEQEGKAAFTVKNISAYELNVDPSELMERFKRGDASRHSEGNGLGLAIAKNLVELQGGVFTITVDGDLFKATVSLEKIQPPVKDAPAAPEEHPQIG